MTRRTVIGSPLLLGAQRIWNKLFRGSGPAGTARGESPNPAPDAKDGILLENSNHKLEFDRKNARLLSFRSTLAPDQEFAVATDLLPVFVIQYFNRR